MFCKGAGGGGVDEGLFKYKKCEIFANSGKRAAIKIYSGKVNLIDVYRSGQNLSSENRDFIIIPQNNVGVSLVTNSYIAANVYSFITI